MLFNWLFLAINPSPLLLSVNDITKVYLPNQDTPILFIMNYATIIDDDKELESLSVPFAMMQRGISIDVTHTQYGGTACGLHVDDQF